MSPAKAATGAPRPTARDYALLGRIFDAAAADRLPLRTRARRIRQLVRWGYVVAYFTSIPLRGPVRAAGYALTDLGCQTYQAWRRRRPEQEQPCVSPSK